MFTLKISYQMFPFLSMLLLLRTFAEFTGKSGDRAPPWMWAEHPVQCRLSSFTEHRTASLARLRLAVVYAEQPPVASSINAADACSAGPSGVGLGRRAGTVASARTELGRPEERPPSAPALREHASAILSRKRKTVVDYLKRAPPSAMTHAS